MKPLSSLFKSTSKATATTINGFNSVLRSLSSSSDHTAASIHYILLRRTLFPNAHTFPFALRSAAGVPLPNLTLSIHSDVTKLGYHLDPFVRTSLADAYSKIGFLRLAVQVFDESPKWWKAQNLLIWNVLITGYVRNGELEKAIEVFEAMPEQTTASWNSLIDGCLRNGEVKKAEAMFERMPERNVVSWTTMISGLSRNGKNSKALGFFRRMMEEDSGGRLKPNEFMIVSVLTVCARMGALENGVWIHGYIKRNGFRLNKVVGAALVDMYAKCGKIDCADQVFNMIQEKDLLTWSAMISGWAMHGCWVKAISFFEDMTSAGIEPDEVVFLSVLMAYSHSGMIDKCVELFNSMKSKYHIEPNVKHYTCMVDLFGRAGRLAEALQFICSMPVSVEADFITWGALFSACKAHKNIEMAEYVSRKLQELKPAHHGSYVFLSNVYAGTGKWEKAAKMRDTMKDKNVTKSPGWSCIEVNGEMHDFVAGDRSHSCSREIYAKLDEVVTSAREQGYNPYTDCVLHDIQEEEKEASLGYHSEKLALAFGLLKTPEAADILIVKNLRICDDCHSMMKFASRICSRVIVVRDNKRFHHFKGGVCSCGDYW